MPIRPPSHRTRAHKASDKAAQHERIRGRKGVKLRERIRREEPLCRHCLAQGRITPTEEIDHIIPLSEGGTNDRENMQGLCSPCHLTKTGNKQQVGADGWPID